MERSEVNMKIQTQILIWKIIFIPLVIVFSSCCMKFTQETPISGKIFFERIKSNWVEICCINIDKSQLQIIIKLPLSSIGDCFISQDAMKILFTLIGEKNTEANIYMLDVENKKQIKLTEHYANISPAFSPDNKKIVFSSDQDRNDYEIYLMDIGSKNIVKLTNNNSNDWEPSWSPNGKKIVFSSDRTGNPEIYSMNIDGTYQTRLTRGDVRNTTPAWSPDGKKIAFIHRYMLTIMDTTGKNLVQLTDENLGVSQPTWSPDGKKIAFTGFKVDEQPDIYVIDIKTKKIINLTNTPNISETTPCWR